MEGDEGGRIRDAKTDRIERRRRREEREEVEVKLDS